MGAENTDRWAPFFEPFFPSPADARQFVAALEVLRLGDARHQAKIMMHQTQRLVSLSDDLPTIREGNEGLRLLFLLVCAENIAKLADKFPGEGQSGAYVRRFFEWFLSPDDQRTLCMGITHHNSNPTTVPEAVKALYEVRCDIVHEGRYWGFHFHDGDTPVLNGDPDVIVSITLAQFRELVVRGCIEAITRYPSKPGAPAAQSGYDMPASG